MANMLQLRDNSHWLAAVWTIDVPGGDYQPVQLPPTHLVGLLKSYGVSCGLLKLKVKQGPNNTCNFDSRWGHINCCLAPPSWRW